MHTNENARVSWTKSRLLDALIISFCATGITLSGLYLHLPLHLPGHRVLPLAFFLLLGRGAAPRRYSGVAIGLLSGGLALWVGIDAHNMVHGVKYLVAGGIIDVFWMLLPSARRSVPLAGLAGGISGLAWLPVGILADRVTGIPGDLMLRLVLFKMASAVIFGAAGGALAAPLARRLRIGED